MASVKLTKLSGPVKPVCGSWQDAQDCAPLMDKAGSKNISFPSTSRLDGSGGRDSWADAVFFAPESRSKPVPTTITAMIINIFFIFPSLINQPRSDWIDTVELKRHSYSTKKLKSGL